MTDNTQLPPDVPLRVQQVESEGRKFAEKYLFPQMQKAYDEGTDPDYALFALMECVSRIIQARHGGHLKNAADDLEHMARSYAESWRLWADQNTNKEPDDGTPKN